MMERTCGAEHEVARAVRSSVMLAEIVLTQPADGFAGAGDLLPQRMSFEQRALGQIVDVDVPPVFVDLVEDLLQDHLALELDLLEERPGEHVAKHGEGDFQPLRVDRGVVVAVVAGGDAVQVPADVFHDRIEEPPVGIAGAPPEEEVLEEVGDAVLPGILVPRPGAYVGGEHAGV